MIDRFVTLRPPLQQCWALKRTDCRMRETERDRERERERERERQRDRERERERKKERKRNRERERLLHTFTTNRTTKADFASRKRLITTTIA